MTFTEYKEKMETVNFLSRRRKKDVVGNLAEHLNVSRRTAKRILHQFSKRGVSITYERILDANEEEFAIEKNW